MRNKIFFVYFSCFLVLWCPTLYYTMFTLGRNSEITHKPNQYSQQKIPQRPVYVKEQALDEVVELYGTQQTTEVIEKAVIDVESSKEGSIVNHNQMVDVQLSKGDLPQGSNSLPYETEGKTFQGPPLMSFSHISSPMDGKSNIEIQRETCKKESDIGVTQECRIVHLISGLKTGSTALAMFLKHSPETNFEVHDPKGPFSNAGKEICWTRGYFSKTRFGSCGNVGHNGEKLVGLDACPWLTMEEDAKKISCTFPDSRYVILLRDPVKRAISHYNNGLHYKWGGYASYTVDKWITNLAEKKENHGFNNAWRIGCYADTLEEFFKYIKGEQILAVQSEAMQWEGTLQYTIDQVSDHFRTERRPNVTISEHHTLKGKSGYKTPSPEVIEKLSEAYRDCNERLFSLLGVRLTHWIGFEDELNP